MEQEGLVDEIVWPFVPAFPSEALVLRERLDAARCLVTCHRAAGCVIRESNGLPRCLIHKLYSLARRVGEMCNPIQIGVGERRRGQSGGKTCHRGVQRAVDDVGKRGYCKGVAVMARRTHLSRWKTICGHLGSCGQGPQDCPCRPTYIVGCRLRRNRGYGLCRSACGHEVNPSLRALKVNYFDHVPGQHDLNQSVPVCLRCGGGLFAATPWRYLPGQAWSRGLATAARPRAIIGVVHEGVRSRSYSREARRSAEPAQALAPQRLTSGI